MKGRTLENEFIMMIELRAGLASGDLEPECWHIIPDYPGILPLTCLNAIFCDTFC